MSVIIKKKITYSIFILLLSFVFQPNSFANRTPKSPTKKLQKQLKKKQQHKSIRLAQQRPSKPNKIAFNVILFSTFVSLLATLGIFATGILLNFSWLWITGIILILIASTLFWAATTILFFPKEWLPWHLIFILIFAASLALGLYFNILALWLMGAILLVWVLILYIIGFSFANKLQKNAGKL